MSSENFSEEKPENTHTNLTLVDNNGNQISYKVKKHIPLGKVLELYGDKYGQDPTSLKISYNGNPVLKSDTPAGLGMGDKGEIEVTQPADGGC